MVFVNGFLCWTDQSRSYYAVAFDFNKEVYNCAIKFHVKAKSHTASVTRYDDSIDLITWEKRLNVEINL